MGAETSSINLANGFQVQYTKNVRRLNGQVQGDDGAGAPLVFEVQDESPTEQSQAEGAFLYRFPGGDWISVKGPGQVAGNANGVTFRRGWSTTNDLWTRIGFLKPKTTFSLDFVMPPPGLGQAAKRARNLTPEEDDTEALALRTQMEERRARLQAEMEARRIAFDQRRERIREDVLRRRQELEARLEAMRLELEERRASFDDGREGLMEQLEQRRVAFEQHRDDIWERIEAQREAFEEQREAISLRMEAHRVAFEAQLEGMMNAIWADAEHSPGDAEADA